jgi:hypothetical protein
MFDRCLLCQAPFPDNQVLEHLPVGGRVAYDPERGRLWAVCSVCRRWTLAPIEERWEALEELEALASGAGRGPDRARLVSETDNISLLRAGRLDIVRIGRASLTEEAWWRYGQQLVSRREEYRKISLLGGVAIGAATLGGWITGGAMLVGGWLVWKHPPGNLADLTRWIRFGSTAWAGRNVCAGCGHVFTELPFSDRRILILRPGPDEVVTPSFSRRCPRCGDGHRGGLHLEGWEAEHTLIRILAYQHFAGASKDRVRAATKLIEGAGGPSGLTRILARHGRHLGDVPRTGAIALEITTNDQREKRLLKLELSALEAQWREEEELASVVDGELTPVPHLASLRRKVAGLL